MPRMLSTLFCAGAVLLVGVGSASAILQSRSQQKCINRINKAAGKVQKAQGKATLMCVSDFVLGGLSAEACLLDDPHDKVEREQNKVHTEDLDNCFPGQVPGFGYTGGVFAGTTAYQVVVDLAHDVFGDPVDAGLYQCESNPAECKCQRQLSSRLESLFSSMMTVFLKCKRTRLEGGNPFAVGATSVADLALCVTSPTNQLSVQADKRGRIAKARGRIKSSADQFCFSTANNEFASGVCNAFDGDPIGLGICLDAQVKCRFCKMLQGIDAMGATIDCAAWSGVPACTP